MVGRYNVYPCKMGEILYQHPAVVEVTLIGVSDGEYGESVKAYVVVVDEQIVMK